MATSILTSRGSEKFVEGPLSVTTSLGRPRQPSIFDQQRIAMARLREEEDARIKNEEDLKRDLLDFSYLTEVDDYGLPLSTPYAVPDSVPDVYFPENPAPAPKEDSPSKVDAEPASTDGGE